MRKPGCSASWLLTFPPRFAPRAFILLLSSEGASSRAIAQKVGMTPSGVRYWRGRYRAEGEAIFSGFDQDAALDFLAASQPEAPAPDVRQPEAQAESHSQPAVVEPDPHTEYAHRLALVLFDGFQQFHWLNPNARDLLDRAIQLAAAQPAKAVRKSRRAYHAWLLSSLAGDSFSGADLARLEALLNLYMGKIKRAGLDRLGFSPDEQKEVLDLLAIMRTADALDTSRSQQTAIQAIEPVPGGLRIILAGPSVEMDCAAAQETLALWKQAGGARLEILKADEVELWHSAEQAFPQISEAAGILPSDLLVEAGRKVMRFQFAQMLAHEAGTRLGDDIEELHDMRVATRRLRASFEVFQDAFQPKVLKRHLKGLRLTGRTLGQVRDLDVLIDNAGGYLASLPEEQREGLAPLIAGWQQDRSRYQAELLAYLDSPDYLEFKFSFNRFVNTPGEGALPQDLGHPVPSLVQEQVPVLVYSRLAAARAYDQLIPNASLEQLHMLRIEFKKFRYTVEFFREVLGSEAQEIIDFLKKVQDHLGALNDANVATQLLRTFLDEWDERQAALPIAERPNPQGIVAYLAYQHAERFRLMQAFHQVWGKFIQLGFRQTLAQAVSVL